MKRVLIIILIFITSNLFSDDTSSEAINISELPQKDIIKMIDKAIEDKDEIIISYLGSLDSTNPDYTKLEDYILKRVNILIQSDDLAFPLVMVEAILYNNLENEEAQELYSSIISKNIEIEARKEAENLKAIQKREELAIQTKEIESRINSESRLVSIIQTNNELLTTVAGYTDSYNTNHFVYTNYIYPLATRFYSSEVYDGYNNRSETIHSADGFSFDSGTGMSLGFLNLRLDMSGTISTHKLFYTDKKLITADSILSIGTNILFIPLYGRLGFVYNSYLYKEKSSTEVAINSLLSPTIGIGITGLKLFKVFKFDLTTDYLIVSSYTKNLDFALKSSFYVTANIFRLWEFNFEVRGGLDNIFYIEGDLSEYSITPRFGFGINSYE